MNKHMVLIISLLFSVSALQGMFFKKNKDKKVSERDNTINIKSLDDVKKMKEVQLAYRGKHNVFKDEHNNVKIEQVEKNS